MSNLIDRYSQIMRKYTDISDCFVNAGGYSLVATLMGRYYKIPFGRAKRPNEFIILASAPYITRRSELLKTVGIVKNAALQKYAGDDKDKYHNELRSLMLESGSPQGLIDAINLHKSKGAKSFCLTSPEFGKILDEMKSQQYMTGFGSLLVKLWGGESDYQTYSERGGSKPRFLEEGTYFNVLASTQKIHHYLDSKTSQTGLARRLLIASLEGTDLTDYKDPLGYDDDAMKSDLMKLGSEFGTVMMGCESLASTFPDGLIPLPCSNDALTLINSQAKDVEISARDNDENPYYLYQAAKWEHILKISANDTIARLTQKTIEIDNVKKANDFVDYATKDVKRILETMILPEEDKKIMTRLNAMLRYIKKGYSRSDTQKYMRGGYGVLLGQFEIYITMLLANRCITLREDGWYDFVKEL